MNESTRWHIRLFGPLHLATNGETARNPAGKARSLLAWLLLHSDRPHTREQVIDALWPELPPDRARRALSDTLYRLRETPAGALVVADGESLAIANPVTLWVDIWEFTRALHSDQLSDIDNALALAAAPLLPEIYDDWMIAQRTTLQDARAALLKRRAAIAEEQNDLTLAQTLYQQVVEDDSLDEDAWRGRIRTLARMGHHRDALDVYARLVQLLEEELDAPPETETSELVAQIRREMEAQRTHAPELMHFVGRARERSHLIAALDAAIDGRGSLTMLLADTGMGRTALLQEVERSARWRGVQVIWGRGDGNLYSAPYSPLREALSAALPEARTQQLTPFVRGQWLDAVQHLLAESPAQGFRTDHKNDSLPSTMSAATIRDQQELALAIASTLRALGQIVPHVILLDDMQWADRSLWHLLDALRQSLGQSRVLIVLSSRLADVQHESAIRERLTAWDQDGSVVVHTLGGLSEGELRELLAHHHLLPTKQERLRQIHLDSGGNPMLAIMLAAVAESATPSRASPADGMFADAIAQGLLLRRFRALPAELQGVLEECAVLGTQFTWQMWSVFRQAVANDDATTEGSMGRDRDNNGKTPANRINYPAFLQERSAPGSATARLANLAGQLEQQGILVLDGATYRFVNTLLQSAIHEHLATERTAHLHRLAFEAFDALPTLSPGQRLRHAMFAGMREQTFHHALQMGKAAAAAFSLHGARDFLALAHANAPELALGKEIDISLYDLYLNRSMVLGLLGIRDEQHADLAILTNLANRLDDDERRVEVANRLANYLLIVGNTEEALAVATAALERAEHAELPLAQASLHETTARIQRERKQVDLAIHHADEAHKGYGACKNQRGISEIIDLRAGLAYDSGDYRRAAQGHLEAANLFGALGDILREAQALNNLGTTYWELGDYAGARATHERAVLVCRESGDLLGEGDNTDNLGGVYWSLGDYDEAIRHYSAALQMRRSMRDEWGIGISLGNLGSALLKQGNPKEALAYYTEAWALYRKNGRRRSEGYVLHNIGCAHLELRDIKSAKACN